MKEGYSYKDGFLEGVVFCFYKGGKVLLEDRGKGFDNEAFFTNGSIEATDKKCDDNYILSALHREIAEEFNGQISPKNEIYLGQLRVPEINVLFYIYCMTDWDGNFPEHISETSEPDSVIKFFDIQSAKQILKYDSALEILSRVESVI